MLDGGLGTCIESKGDTLDPLLWSSGHLVTNPSLIQQIHKEYLLAGADIVTTSAYQVSYEGFQTQYQYCTDKVDDLLQLSTNLARNAIDEYHEQTKTSDQKFVAASIGCYGAHFANGSEFHGGYTLTSKELHDWHLPKLQFLLKTNPDILGFETVPLLEEVKAITSLLSEIPLIPAWTSCACKSGELLTGGDRIEDVCRSIEDVDYANCSVAGQKNIHQMAIGVNCTDPNHIDQIITTFKDCCHKGRPIICYPNRGDFWVEETNSYADVINWSPQEFAEKALEWYHLGANIIGSCCKTDPSYINAISTIIQREEKRRNK